MATKREYGLMTSSKRTRFEKIVDLGEWWKRGSGLPLPLGGNVVRKDSPPQCTAI